MDSFEQIVSYFLEADGYWTRIGVRINVSRKEKAKLGKRTIPRPELDVVAFKPATNELLVVECKGYLDSCGVSLKSFLGDHSLSKNRFKIFNDSKLRRLVRTKLVRQFKADGLLRESPKLIFALAAGKINSEEQSKLEKHFSRKKWRLFTPQSASEKS